MRWLADECVDAGLVKQLRDAGHDVLYVADAMPGATDAEILACAEHEARLLLTEDKDFGELVFRAGMEVPGLVLLRIDPAPAEPKGHVWSERLRIMARACSAAMSSSSEHAYAPGYC